MKRTCLCLVLVLTSCIKTNSNEHPGSTPGETGTGTAGNGNAPSATGAGPDGSFTGAQVRYIGRVDTTGAGGVWLAWGGSGAEVRVSNGTHVDFELQNQQHMAWNSAEVWVDGAKTQTIKVQDTNATYTVPLTAGAHTVTLLKRNEAGNGVLILSKIATDGTLANVSAQAERRIEFIGDTISTGYAVDGTAGVTTCTLPPDCVADPNLQNAMEAYPVLTAKALNANWSVEAFSGRGLMYNLDGTQGGDMAQLWSRTNPLDYNSTYAFPPNAAPQVVVINLGTNDINNWVYNPNSPPDQPGFTAAYVQLVKSVRSHYPNAQIMLAVGPQLSKYQCLDANSVNGACVDPNGTTVPGVLTIMETMVKSVITQVADANVTFVEFPTDATNVACDYLPDATGQQQMATLLSTAIGQATGWTAGAATHAAPLHEDAASDVSTISSTNPPLPDPIANAGDPNVTGINPGQYPECNYCSLQPYDQAVAQCPNVVGVPQACDAFCHVPDGFAEVYTSNPPTSGNHYPEPEATLGEHVSPVLRGHYIHSMEHGAIILAYNCPQGCTSELTVLRNVLAQRSGHLVIMTPDPGITTGQRFAAMSWTWLYSFDTPDENALLCFIDQHELYGRECVNKVCPALTSGAMQSVP